MHITLPILAGHMIMGTDAPESMGFELSHGSRRAPHTDEFVA